MPSGARCAPRQPARTCRPRACRHWMHSEMWWPKLLRQHAEIAWDDYEKDYSDLPEEVLQRHRWALVQPAALSSPGRSRHACQRTPKRNLFSGARGPRRPSPHTDRLTEAMKEDERCLEAAEKTEREVLQERDDLRKRTRQERLHTLRTGEKKTWVELHRANPY